MNSGKSRGLLKQEDFGLFLMSHHIFGLQFAGPVVVGGNDAVSVIFPLELRVNIDNLDAFPAGALEGLVDFDGITVDRRDDDHAYALLDKIIDLVNLLGNLQGRIPGQESVAFAVDGIGDLLI